MMFADDVVSCMETRELQRWRETLEVRDMKVSQKNKKYLCTNGETEWETIKIQEDEILSDRF